MIRVRKRKLYGVGVNDVDYMVKTKGFICPFYTCWANMLKRCYNESYRKIHPSYVGCTVHPKWCIFSNFKAWMETQDWEGKQLDKDIVQLNNKQYGESCCLFVSNEVNGVFTKSKGVPSELPEGVHPMRSGNVFAKFGSKYLGSFQDPQEARKAYLQAKINYVTGLILQQSNIRVVQGLNRLLNTLKQEVKV